MAFGKNPNVLAQAPNFRQQNRMIQDNRPAGGSKRAAPYFVNQYKPNDKQGAPPDRVHLIRGAYEVPIGQPDGTITTQIMYYWPAIEHYYATTKQGFICSAGPLGAFKGKGDPCRGCEKFWGDKMAGIKNGPMSRRELYILSALHFGDYVRIPQVDKRTGQPKTNDQGEPYLHWVNVQAHEVQKYQGYEHRDWHLLHWPLGFGHWNVLCDYDFNVGTSCKSCGGVGTLSTVVWLCGNPNCGIDLIDPNSGAYSIEDINKITGAPVTCSHCHTEGYLQELVQCTNCSTPSRADIFDVTLLTKRVKDPKGNSTSLQIVGFEPPRELDQRFLVPDIDENGKERPPIAHAIDLPKIYKPATIEEQDAMIGSGGARRPADISQMSRSWNAQNSQPQQQAAPSVGGQFTRTPGPTNFGPGGQTSGQ